MTIDSIFNETELAIFQRQTGFTFGECYKSSDGTIFSVDRHSSQFFVGSELFRNNVHALDSLASACLENGQVHLKYKDSSSAVISFDEEAAGAVMAGLGDFPEPDAVPEDAGDGQPVDDNGEQPLTADELSETYARLANTGRSRALGYLVAEVGMSVKEAGKYLDELEKNEGTDEVFPESDFYRDGSMTKKAILKTVKELKPGDRIHLEYKPLIGKLRVYDTEYLKLVIDLANSRYFSLYASNVDYNSLMDDAAEDLFGSMEIYIFCEETCSEISCRLKQVRVLQIIDKKERCS